MDSQRYQALVELFRQACELDPQARHSLLDEVGAEDPVLRREVESLLENDACPSRIIDESTRGAAGDRLLEALENDDEES